MKAGTLVIVRIILYTLVSLGITWQTSMTDVDWLSLTWVAKSCVIAGMVVLWGNSMMAFLDKSVWKMDEEAKAKLNAPPPEVKP
jgi:hypothetical protein